MTRCQAKITPIEQGQYIGLALTGAFQAFGWRNHSGIDPDQQRVWWQSSASAPIGALALNFGRFKDAEIDAALETIKTNRRPGRPQGGRRGDQQALRRRRCTTCGRLWVLWGIITQPYVNGVETATRCPTASRASASPAPAVTSSTGMWCDGREVRVTRR